MDTREVTRKYRLNLLFVFSYTLSCLTLTLFTLKPAYPHGEHRHFMPPEKKEPVELYSSRSLGKI